MVAAILAHTSSCFNFLLKDDISRKYGLCIDFGNNDFLKILAVCESLMNYFYLLERFKSHCHYITPLFQCLKLTINS